MAKTDIYQEVTDNIIEALESGVSPWQCPWERSTVSVMPYNFGTGALYSGINILLLYLAATKNGYGCNAWLTYKQAQAIGGQVQKGARSVRCIFYKTLEIEGKSGDEDKVLPMARWFSLFNIDQIDGVEIETETKKINELFSPIEAAESLLAASGAKIEEKGQQAFFAPAPDLIVLPERVRFARAEDFYATATHELTHWTGHKSRLDRDFKGRFGETSYAFEELIAEIGSAFINAELGLEGDLQHASYIKNWLEIMKDDKRAIFTAASQASKAHQFIMEKTATTQKKEVAA